MPGLAPPSGQDQLVNRRLLALSVLGAVAATAIVAITIVVLRGGSQPVTYRGTTPVDRYELPGFSLRDQNGKLVTTRQLRGKVVVLTFLDTDCKESCPVIAGMVGASIPRLSQAEQEHVRAVAITVNPGADTPAKARRFLRQRRALGSLDFLLGSVPQLQPLWREFMILTAQQTGNANIHSAPVRIYDRDGVWVSTLHAGADLSTANLVHDVRQALRQ
jgi:protein SCO1